MKKGFVTIEIVLGVILLIIIIAIASVFNTYVSFQNKFNTDKQVAQQTNGDLDSQLQRRFDLINETVGATKGALSHETTIFNDIAKQQAAFTQAHNTGNTQGELDASSAVASSVGQALRGYFVVQQQYPQEYALQSVKDLQTEIDGSETRISVFRQRYNNAVNVYDTEISNVPGSWYNSIFFHFQPLPYYQNSTSSNNAPTVNLGQ